MLDKNARSALQTLLESTKISESKSKILTRHFAEKMQKCNFAQ
jgi:hypothetical protein